MWKSKMVVKCGKPLEDLEMQKEEFDKNKEK